MADSKLKSSVWKFFKPTEDNKGGTCNLCGKTLTQTQGNTSNLIGK